MTLFEFMTTESWSGVVRQVLNARPWALLGFVSWIVITAFFFLPLFLGTITETLVQFNELEDTRLAKEIVEQSAATTKLQSEEMMREIQNVARRQQELIQNQLKIHETLEEVVRLVKKRAVALSGQDDLDAYEIYR